MDLHIMWYLCGIFLLTAVRLSQTQTSNSVSYTQPESNLHYVTPRFLNESKLTCISCKDRCGEISKPLIDNKDNTFCSCDEQCVDYGDCCPDYNQVCYKTKTAHNKVIPSYCKSDIGGGFLLIKHCAYSSSACQVKDDIITTQIPVTDLKTGLHYVHSVCASCNGVTNMQIWNANVSTEYKKETVRDSLQKEANPTIVVSKPESLPPKRWCIPKYKINQTCQDEWENDQIRTLCEDGYRGYVNKDRFIYHNIYCAMCNNLNAVDILCETGTLARFMGPRLGPIYSFKLLFTGNTASGLHLTGICESDEVYIPAEDRCMKTRLTADEQRPFIQLNITLYHKRSKITPISSIDMASSIVTKLQKHYSNLNYAITNSVRNWKEGYDSVVLDVNENSPNTIHALVNIGTNMSAFLANNKFEFQNVSVVSLISAGALHRYNNCTNVLHSMKDVKADIHGVVTLPGGEEIRPGFYVVTNNTLIACVKSSTSVWDDILGWVTFISMTVSVICIIIHITLNYIYKPKKRWRTTGLACCLLVTFVTFLMTPILKHEDKACYGAGVVLHLSFLASFCWMNFISIDIYLALSTVQLQKSRAQKRSDMWKYLMPFLPAIAIVVMTVAIERLTLYESWKAKYGFGPLCWIQEFTVVMYLFILPGGLSVLITTLFTILCSCKLFCLWKTTRNAVAKERNYFMMFLKLAAMTGTGWCVGFVAVPTGNPVLFIVFVLLTATQGIWLLLVVWGSRCKKIVRKMQRKASSSSVRTKDTPLTGTSL